MDHLDITYYFEYYLSTRSASLIVILNDESVISKLEIKLISRDNKRALHCSFGCTEINIPIGNIPITLTTPSFQKLSQGCWRILFNVENVTLDTEFNEFIERLPSSEDLSSVYCRECGISYITDESKRYITLLATAGT